MAPVRRQPRLIEAPVHTLHSRPHPLSRRFRSTITALTAFALLFGASLVAAPAATAAATGSITGVVTSAEGGSKLDGIAVLLLPAFSPTSSGDNYLDYDETNSQGKFSFSGLAAGKYRVFFETEGRDYVPQYFGGEPGDRDGEIAPLTVGSTAVDASTALSVGGTYSGHIENAKGAALKDIYVYAMPLDESSDYYYYGEDSTDNNGDFEIGGLQPGEYELQVVIDYDNLAGRSIDVAPIVDGSEIVVDDVVLAVGAKITGIVKDAAGKPVKNAAVVGQALNPDGTASVASYGYGYTNKYGVYTLTQLPVGDIQVAVLRGARYGATQDYAGGSDDSYLAVPVKVTKAGSTSYRDIRLAKGATVSGTVRNASGKTAAKIPVQVIQNDLTGEGISYGSFGSSRTPHEQFTSSIAAKQTTAKATAKAAVATGLESTTAAIEIDDPETTLKVIDEVRTDKNGKYVIHGLTAGSYSLYFGDNVSGGLPGAVATKSLFLGPKSTTVNATLSKSVVVSGTVKSSAGKALRYATVEAIRVGGGSKADLLADSFGARGTYTSKSGKYSLGLPPGKWVLKFSSDYNSVGTRYLGGGTFPSAPNTTRLVVKSKALKKKNVTLPTGGANVGATVVSAEGLKDAGGLITLERLVAGKVVERTVQSTDYFDDWDEAPGYNTTFPLRRLADGDYRVVLAPTSYFVNWAVGETAVPFTVAKAKVTKVSGKSVTPGSTLGTIRLATPTAVTSTSDATISGTASVGQSLKASGSGLPADASVYYAWYRDGRPITGAFDQNYRVQPSDLGARLQVAISAFSDSSYFDELSDETAKVGAGTYPVAAGAPKVTGSGRVGSSLSAPAGTKAKYQWLVNGFAIPGATAKTFAVRIADFGDSLSVKVSVNGKAWTTSAPVAVRTGSAVTLSGKAKLKVVGKTGAKPVLGSSLTSTTTGVPGNAIVQSYQWQVNRGSGWENLSGKIGPSLGIPKTASADYAIGYSYRVVQTIERSATTTGPAITSSALKLVKK